MSQLATKEFFNQPTVQARIEEIVGKSRKMQFITSVLQIVNSNDMLKNADPITVYNAALMAAVLDLPINNNLGFAYIVPFRNNKANKTEAQFQLGYKGFIQLAQRSGQFSRIAATPVYAGQLIAANPLLGYEFDWTVQPNGEPIGYVAFFRLINGFTSELYMSKDEVTKHANKYSQTAKKGYGVWKDQFEAMAIKTVIKLLLSKYAPLSIEMQRAVESDQAVLLDVTSDGQSVEYIDNQPQEPQKQIIDVSNNDEAFKKICGALVSGELSIEFVVGEQSSYTFSDDQMQQLQAFQAGVQNG